MLPKKKLMPAKPKKDDIDDWINKEFQNIVEKNPKKNISPSNNSQEDLIRAPFKPNFKVKSSKDSEKSDSSIKKSPEKSETAEEKKEEKKPLKPNFYEKAGLKSKKVAENSLDPTSFIKDIKKEYNIKSTKPKEIENYEPIRKEEFIKETKMIKKNEEEDYPEDFDDYKDDFEPLEEPTPELIKKALENKKDNKTNSNKKQKEEDSDSDEISKTNKTDNNNNIITNKPLFSGVNFKKPFQNVATLQRNEKIDERKINLEENILSLEKKEASESKKDFQRNRILQFQSMIELDLYEELLDIPPSSEYDVYMTKIKSGSIKNSADQSNDNLPCKEIQTEEITYNDGENQCPDDYNKTVLKKRDENDENFDEILGLQNTQRFIEFINNAGPLIEEILSKGRQTIKKPTKTMELLNFILPDFLSEIDFSIGNCFITNESTYIVFLISLKGGKYSLVIEFMNEKANRYFLANTYLSQISLMENYLLGGTEEGTLLLWDLRMSELHCSQLETNQVIKKFKQSINRDLILRYPVFSTEFELNNTLSCISNYNHMAPIKQIYVNPDRLINNEIITLDQLNHLIFWNVIDLSYNETQRNYLQYGFNSKAKISQIMQINLSNIFLEEFISQQNIYNFNCFDIDLLDNHVFLSSNTQIIKLDKLGSTNVIPPKVYIGSDYDDCFPKIIKIMSINGFYGGFQDGRIGIFSKGYYIPKIWIDGFTNKAIINIFIMFLEVKIKDTKKKIKFFDNSKILALDAGSIIYVFDFSQDSKKPIDIIDLNKIVGSNEKIRGIEIGSIDGLLLNAKICIVTQSNKIFGYILDLSKYMEKDPKKIKKNNIDLLKELGINYDE